MIDQGYFGEYCDSRYCYLSNIKQVDSHIAKQAVELCGLDCVYWFDHPIPYIAATNPGYEPSMYADSHGCVAVDKNHISEGSAAYHRAFKIVEQLVK